MRFHEMRPAPIKVVFPGFELTDAVVGEFSNDLFLSRVQRPHIGRGARNAQAEGASLLGEVQHLCRPEQGFRGHAAAQDAQATEVARAIHDGNCLAQTVRHPGGVETGGTSADGNKIIFTHARGPV